MHRYPAPQDIAPQEASPREAPTLRDLLISLYATDRLPRTAALRLALTAETWSGLRPTNDREDPKEPKSSTADEITPGEITAEATRDTDSGAIRPPEDAALLRRARQLIPTARHRAQQESERARRGGARLITRLDQDYPAGLLRLPQPPSVIGVRGELTTAPTVALVGSRKASREGRQLARELARDLAGAGWTVVSGFAVGIDIAAHDGALEASGGRTVAVLGCGLGHRYPRAHWDLGQDIASRGAVVSELPWNYGPRPWTFPARNRIIAGLSRGIVVVRGGYRSGALITARHGLDLGLEVMAMPGSPRDPLAIGCHRLLRDGATLVTDAREVLEALTGFRPADSLPLPFDTPSTGASEEPSEPAEVPEPNSPKGRLLRCLATHGARSLEALVDGSDLGTGETLSALAELELGGQIRRLPGPTWERVLPRPR